MLLYQSNALTNGYKFDLDSSEEKLFEFSLYLFIMTAFYIKLVVLFKLYIF